MHPSERTAHEPRVASAAREPIAIVGIGCRFPGAPGLHEFWRLLLEGENPIREIPAERFEINAFHDPRPRVPGKLAGRGGGFVDGVFEFDADYFRISAREASRLDPQQRLMLEVTAEALDDAYLSDESLRRHTAGVYIGCWSSDWECAEHAERMSSDVYSMAGSGRCLLSGRISFAFDLRGPSLTVDTACSGSLTSIHLACESLRSGESKLAIAGGVNLDLHPTKYRITYNAGMLSPEGQCRTFGANAGGYVPGEGAGAVLLKPLADAQRDGDRIHAVIKTTVMNHGGRASGFNVPNPTAQGNLIAAALAKAGVDAQTLNYIEAHGTGTELGDPVEIGGLSTASRNA